ncbi:MAG: TRAP transporter small permease [Pseudoprimorskyibacter sp.]|nr:TRAP transporter small permease [Pseudoprimorskyibacter sp.]
MISVLVRYCTLLFKVMAVLAAIAGTLIVVMIGASVTMRYLAYTPFRFTEELVGLLMTAAFFLALPLVTFRAEHVRVQVLVAALPDTARLWVTRLAAAFGAVFCLWFFGLCLPWFEFAFERNIKTEVGRLLMYPWMALLPLSMILTMLAFVFRVASVTQRPADTQAR